MKSIAVFAVVLFLAAACGAASYGGGSAPSYGGGAAPSYAAAAAPASGGYGSSSVSIPAPPCPKNYIFSCAPNLSPAPCAPAAGGYGSAGAYSQNYPVYDVPNYFNGYETY